MNCRFCNSELENILADLGETPLANSYLNSTQLQNYEKTYPLCAFVCSECLLVQVDEFESPDNIFSDYAYFSSYSKTWLEHIEKFTKDAIERFSLEKENQVIEIASNDGYLLQFFKNFEIKTLGIEPAANVSEIAREKGIDTITKFFGSKTAMELTNDGKSADLLLAFNVLPHVPDLNDFIKGLKILLNEKGVAVIQFSAYLLKLIEEVEFDVIYHEHFSYFSLLTLKRIFEFHNLTIFDIKELSIHGGSLRLYIKHSENDIIKIENSVEEQILIEKKFGLEEIETYKKFQEKVLKIRKKVFEFFNNNKERKIVAYGAAAKGNTFLNYCNIDKDMIEYVSDISPHKQGLYLPGTHIPIYKPEKIFETKPDYVIILAWNFKEEIIEQLKNIKEWDAKFVVFFPEMKII